MEHKDSDEELVSVMRVGDRLEKLTASKSEPEPPGFVLLEPEPNQDSLQDSDSSTKTVSKEMLRRLDAIDKLTS